MSLARQVRKYLLSWWWDAICRAHQEWVQGSAVIADLQAQLVEERRSRQEADRFHALALETINELQGRLEATTRPPPMVRAVLDRELQDQLSTLRPGAIVETPYREVYTAREYRGDNGMINWTHHEPGWIPYPSPRRNPEWRSNQERALSQRRRPTTFTGPEQEDL